MDSSDEDAPRQSPPSMQRGVSQLLFNYLPERTVDWEDGLAVVRLAGVRLSTIWESASRAAVLDEVAELFQSWRERGGTIDPLFPDPKTRRGEFAIGMPESIGATVLQAAMICQACSRLQFPKRNELARPSGGPLTCPSCGKAAVRQFGQVFVHGCGELVAVTEWLPATRQLESGALEPTSHPVRCQKCGPGGALFLPLRSERVRDMKVVCHGCGSVVAERLTARCSRCLNEIGRNQGRHADAGDGAPESTSRPATIVARILMRMTRYSASDAYYPQSLSMLRLDRPILVNVSDPERELLRSLLPERLRPDADTSLASQLQRLVEQLKAASMAGNQQEAARLTALIAQEAGNPMPRGEGGQQASGVRLSSPDLGRAVSESLAFRETVNSRPALEVASGGGSSSDLVIGEIENTRERLGLREVLLVQDLPVIVASFGYTRRSFEPTYEETGVSSGKLPTQIRAFPSLDKGAARRLGRAEILGAVPILAREGEHEGIFLSLEPQRVVAWLEANGVRLPASTTFPLARILEAIDAEDQHLGRIDKYYDDIWRRPARRLVFGLVHSLSHAAMRVAGRFAGVDRTSLCEYVFLPLLGTAVFDNSSTFRLGGMQTLARDHLLTFLRTLAEGGIACLYDPHCMDYRGACHGCIHSPEICCRVFNHGLSRNFLVGGHAPWADIASAAQIAGYWSGKQDLK